MISVSIFKNLSFTIVLSFVVLDHVQTRAVDDELTIEQLEGRWYDMGKISTCKDNLAQQCMTYEVFQLVDNSSDIFQARVRIHDMPICDYGIPIYSNPMPGKLVGSRIDVEGNELNPAFSSTVKKYNNGRELIFTDLGSDTCGGKSYRLWSQLPEVSAETKAEFEKLATHGVVKYHDWDRCPKLPDGIDDVSTLKQLDGLWYAIAHISIRNRDKNRCTTFKFTMDYENQTFNMMETANMPGYLSKVRHRGGIFHYILKMEVPSFIVGDNKLMTILSAVSCNNGADQIVRLDNVPNFLLVSRKRKVSSETMSEFEKLYKNFAEAHYTIYPRENCSNRTN